MKPKTNKETTYIIIAFAVIVVAYVVGNNLEIWNVLIAKKN